MQTLTVTASRMRLGIFFSILFLGLATAAHAGPLEEANVALDKRDLKVVAESYRALAFQGDGTAQFKLGAMYDEGKGVEKNSHEAMRWYLLAAAQGSAGAAYNLGRLYDDGSGIPQNYKLARRWYKSAAERGSTKAAVNLGHMDTSGDGGPRDYKKAIEWFLFAAKRGDDSAKNNMGYMYLNGLGVRRNLILAHAWFNMAAAHGETVAIKNREGVARALTPTQIARAQQLASQLDLFEHSQEALQPSKKHSGSDYPR